MDNKVFVYDQTANDKLSSVRGIGRYMQILKENFPNWTFSSKLLTTHYKLRTTFINPFYNFYKLPLNLKRIAQKQIAVIHDLIPLKYPSHFPAGIRGKINFFLNRLALKNYDLIITDSEASKKDTINILKIKSEKVKVIYPCLPKSFLKLNIKNLKFNKNCKLKIRNSFCLYVGDATWNKNLVNLAKAIKIADIKCVFVGKVFKSRSEDIRFERSFDFAQDKLGIPVGLPTEVEGEGGSKKRGIERLNNLWQKELKEFYEIAKDDKRFIFAGFVPDSELIKLYQQAAFNILPSRDEGFGFSYLEAASQHCPSLLADIPVFREISDNAGAVFADPDNPQNMADVIMEIISDAKKRERLKNDAYIRSNFFTRQKFIKQFRETILS